MSEAAVMRGDEILSKWIKELKRRENKNISIIQDELGHSIGYTSDLIYHWRKGNPPSTIIQAVTLAKEIVKRLKVVDKDEFHEFLKWAGHTHPEAVWDSLFVRVDGPQSDIVNIFIGRQEEIDELCHTLQPGQVVVLWGPGGVGKTSLIREVIQRLDPNKTAAKQFPHGILYYDFYGPEYTAEDALRYIAQFFRVDLANGFSPRDAASLALRDKIALIVLDGAEEADDLRKIWRIRHQCGMLIGSRYQHLDLSSQIIYLDILPPDEAVATLRAWSTAEEKHLSNSFQVWSGDSNKHDQSAHEICEELGRLPLALRLAGRYMLYRRVNPAKFLSLWQEWKLSLLHEGNHRHDSLQILIGKSLEQVSQVGEDARHVMAVAGLLSYQPFSSEVVASALEKSTSGVEKLLQDLWKFSLIVQISSERWQIVHRLVYTYAQRIGTTKDVIARLAAYYTTLANEQSRLHGEGYKRLNTERAHIMAVLEWCTKREDWEAAQNLSEAVKTYLYMQDYDSDRILVNKYGLKAAQALGDRKKEGIWQASLGSVWQNLKKGPEAFEHYHQALIISREIGDRLSELTNLGRLGWVSYLVLHKFEQASDYIQQALDIAREIGNRESEYTWLIHMGAVHANQGNKERGIEYIQQALSIAQEIGNRSGEIWALDQLGTCYVGLEKFEIAIEYFQRGLKIAQEIGNRSRESSLLRDLGHIYHRLNKIEQAIIYLQQALSIAQEIGNLRLEIRILENLGALFHEQGNDSTAIEFFQHGLASVQNLGDKKSEVPWLDNLADSYFRMGQYDMAIKYYQQALAISRKNNDRKRELLEIASLGAVYDRIGQYQAAIDYNQQALAISREIGERHKLPKILHNMGAVAFHQNDYAQAYEYMQQALSIAGEIGDHQNEVANLIDLGGIHIVQAQYEEAIQVYQRALVLNPDSSICHDRLADIYLRLGRLNEAIYHWHRCLELSPDDSINANISLGVINLQQGKDLEAHRHFETALAMCEKSLTAQSYTASALGEYQAFALLCLGQMKEALKTLKKALNQRRPGSIIDFLLYDLVAKAPNPPLGLSKMRRLLEKFVEKNRDLSMGG